MQKIFKILGLLLISLAVKAQSPFELQKLEDFAKMYGVVRYFHPSDEASEINWNNFAAYGVGEISQAKDQKDFEAKLKDLFLPIAPSISFDSSQYKWRESGLYPVFWIHNGLGIDSKAKANFYHSARFNREGKYKSLYIKLEPKDIKNSIKVTYEAKNEGEGESFAYIKVYNVESKKENFKTHEIEPVTSSNEWVKKELYVDNNSPIERIEIGLAVPLSGTEYRDVKLWYQNDRKDWISYDLPSFSSKEWTTTIPNNLIERYDTDIKFKGSTNLKAYDINWDKYVTLNLSDKLNVTIPTVVYSNQNGTIPVADKKLLAQLQSQLKSENFNQNIALANVIISWNILKHFFPYREEIKVDWDGILEASLKDAYNDMTEYDNYLTLNRFLANFKDGHMFVFYKGLMNKINYTPGVALRYRNDELIVKDVMPDVEGIHKGDVVTTINGIAAKKYMDSLQQYISGSKQHNEWVSVGWLLRGEQNSALKFGLKGGKEVTLLRDKAANNEDFYFKDDVTKAKEINPETYYVNMDKLSADEMQAEIPNIREHKNLIIDLRGYPKDGSHTLLNYLLPIKDSTKWLCRKEIYLPDFKYYKETCNGHRLRTFISDNPLKTNNVLLVDERSQSNAEMFSQIVKYYKLATIIGRPTSGANGTVNIINLLDGFSIRFTGSKVTNPDGTRFHAVGVIPDIWVNETAEDIKNGKDAYIEKALEFFQQKND